MKKALLISLVLFVVLMCACSAENVSDVTTTTQPLNIAQSITLGYYKDGEPKTVTDTDLKELLQYDEIHSLVLANYNGTDLSILRQIKGLRSLKLQSMENLTDISFLKELTDLRFLMIYDLSDDFNDLTVLSELIWLESLSVNNISVDDFSPLYSLRQLKSLDLTSTALTQAQYNALMVALPDCEIKNVTIYE